MSAYLMEIAVVPLRHAAESLPCVNLPVELMRAAAKPS